MPQEPDGGVGGVLRVTTQTLGWKVVSAAAVGVAGVVTARQLGPNGRGVLALYLAVATATMLFTSLGVDASARLLLARPEDPLELRHYFGLCAALVGAHTLLCAGLGLVLLPLVNVDVTLRGSTLLAALGAGLLGQSLLYEALNAYGLVSEAAAIEAVGGIAQLLGIVALALSDEVRATPFITAIALGSVLQIGLSVFMLHRRGKSVRPRYNRLLWTSFVRLGLGGMLVNLGQGLSFRIDRYLIGLFLTPTAVGLYAVASTPTELLRLPGLALGEVVYHRLASGSASVVEMRRYRQLCLLTTVALSVVCFALAPVAVPAIFGEGFAGAVTPLRILLVAELGLLFYQLDSATLFGLGHISDVARASITGLAVVIVADIALIKSYGLAGAAWASVASYSVMGMIVHERSRRRSRISLREGAMDRSAEGEP